MANETMASKRIRLKADLTQSDFLELVDQPENQTLLDLIPQVVRVEHPLLPDGTWFLRLPELVVPVNAQRNEVDYQEVRNWEENDGAWRYPEIPLSANGNYQGTIATRIESDADTVTFEISLTNQGHRPWENTLAWLCFNHHPAQNYYRTQTYILSKGGWELTKLTGTHSSFPVGGCELPWWERNEQKASQGIIATCIQCNGEPFVIAIASPTALLLGQSSAWPCIDIGIGFGDPPAGATVSRTGRIYFHKGTLDELAARFRSEFSEASSC